MQGGGYGGPPGGSPPPGGGPYGQNPYGQPQQGQGPYGQPQQGPYGQPQPGYAQPPNPYAPPPGPGMGMMPMPGAPFGVDPMTGIPFSDKSRVVAGLLQIFLGGFGAGRFYTGHMGIAIAQIAVSWLTCGLGVFWPIIDGIMMFSGKVTDSDGRPLRDGM